MKTIFLLFIFTASVGLAKPGKYTDTKFSDSENNFKVAMQKILDRYIDKNLSRDDLYKAATDGMLASLNSPESNGKILNKLLSPDELNEMQSELSGKITGIGASLKFDEHSGYALILKTIPHSPAERAGLKAEDQILSVDGKKYKGKQFTEMLSEIRGQTGKSVELKVLRDDKILSFNIKREVISWEPVDYQKINESTGLLTIDFFNEKTPQLAEAAIKEINQQNIEKLILDLRGNEGGGFEQAVKTAELFLPNESLIVSTKDRDGKTVEYHTHKSLLKQNIQLILLTDKNTASGGELFAAAIRENKKVKTIGESTFGKWNAQIIDSLPNKFAIKFTVKQFQSPSGKSYQDVGLKPDLEISLPKDVSSRELHTKLEISKRLNLDTQLKAALELLRAG
jgi:carboxyl-terminal processing protease